MPAMAMPAVELYETGHLFFRWDFVLTDKGIHTVRGRGHNYPKDQQGRAHYSNVSAAHEIGERADEGANCCQSQKVGQDLLHN